MKFIYVVMPVSSDSAYGSKRAVIEAVAREMGVETHFPADVYGTDYFFNVKQTIANMRSAVAVIADLSLERPSCYYEVGLAQALECLTFLIADSAADIHQVNDRDKVSRYNSLENLRQVIKTLIREIQLDARSSNY